MNTPQIRTKPYDKEEISKAREAFSKMKTYKDGTIHQSETMEFCNIAGLPTNQEQADMYNTYWQANRGDDRVPIDEVMEILSVIHDSKQLPLVVAKYFDRNGDGIISQEEFEVGMQCMMAYDPTTYGEMGKIAFKDFLVQADTNKDGKIQIEELADWLGKN